MEAKLRELVKEAKNSIDLYQAPRYAINELYKVPWENAGYKNEAIADAMAIYNVAKEQSPFLKFYKNKNK